MYSRAMSRAERTSGSAVPTDRPQRLGLVRTWPSFLAIVLTLGVAACSASSVAPSPSVVSSSAGSSAASPTSPPLTTVAGGGTALGDGGQATSAALCGPTDVALDAAGTMYIADPGILCTGPGGDTVRRVDPNGIITTIAGTGVTGFSGDGGPATAAQLNEPQDVAVDDAGNLYIADLFNYRIRKVDLQGIITTVAGTGQRGFSGDGGPATAAQVFNTARPGLNWPGGMDFDAEGNLYVADGGAIRKIDTAGTITTVAGTGVPGFSGDDGVATKATIDAWDVAVDSDGNIYLSEWHNVVIRRVDRNGTITTVAGGGNGLFGAQGVQATSIPLRDPWGIAVDANGDVFIAEHHANLIRRVDPHGIITSVGGANQPIGLFVDAAGALFIADTFDAKIRAIQFRTAP